MPQMAGLLSVELWKAVNFERELIWEVCDSFEGDSRGLLCSNRFGGHYVDE